MRTGLVSLNVLVALVAVGASVLLRFGPEATGSRIFTYMPLLATIVALRVVLFAAFRLDVFEPVRSAGLWRTLFVRLLLATAAGSAASLASALILFMLGIADFAQLPRSVVILEASVYFVLLAAMFAVSAFRANAGWPTGSQALALSGALMLAVLLPADRSMDVRLGLVGSQFDKTAAAFDPTSAVGPDPLLPPEERVDHPMAVALHASAMLRNYEQNGRPTSLNHGRTATARLVEMVENGPNGAFGWGLGFSWDAFGDGSENPQNAVYGITTALAIQALLDHFEITGNAEYLPVVDRVLEQYSAYFTVHAHGGYFWYSEMPSDSRPVINVSAMLAGQYARAGTLLGNRHYLGMAELAARYILAHAELDQNGMQWPYEIGRDVSNDAVHAAYVVQGLSEVQAHHQDVDYDQSAALSYLRAFFSSAPLVVERVGESVPARSWGVGYLMFVLCEYGAKDEVRSHLAKAIAEYEFAPGSYGMHPGEEVLYPRFQAHVLLGFQACAL